MLKRQRRRHFSLKAAVSVKVPVKLRGFASNGCCYCVAYLSLFLDCPAFGWVGGINDMGGAHSSDSVTCWGGFGCFSFF